MIRQFRRCSRFFGHLVLLLALVAPVAAQSQSRGRIPPNLRNPDRLDPEEGARVINQFRQVHLAGDFVFAVDLVHEPHRGDTETYRGVLSGHAADTLRTRVDLPATEVRGTARRFLQWGGFEPRLWTLTAAEGAVATPVEGEALLAPLLPGINYTPFDLQMPFMHWRDFAYEGSRRLRGRPVHYFLLYPPEDDARYAGIGAVRVAIDADFNVAVRAETLDPEGEPTRRLEVQSVKEVDDQWIVRRIDLIDLRSRDRTRLVVTAARVGLDLPDELFTPEGLTEDLPPIELKEL